MFESSVCVLSVSGQETCKRATVANQMPQVSADRNYQGHHTHMEGLSVEDRYEKRVVLTHWLSGMLQPQHPTGPYLSGADCTA